MSGHRVLNSTIDPLVPIGIPYINGSWKSAYITQPLLVFELEFYLNRVVTMGIFNNKKRNLIQMLSNNVFLII